MKLGGADRLPGRVAAGQSPGIGRGSDAKRSWRLRAPDAQNPQCGPGASNSARNGRPTGAMITLTSTAG
jgi:hypothetical protein